MQFVLQNKHLYALTHSATFDDTLTQLGAEPVGKLPSAARTIRVLPPLWLMSDRVGGTAYEGVGLATPFSPSRTAANLRDGWHCVLYTRTRAGARGEYQNAMGTVAVVRDGARR
jgi:hypothetical protein